MKNLVTFIITLIIVLIMDVSVNAATASASEVTEVEINPYTYITVLNAEQLKAVNDINRYYGDAHYNALGKGYVDGKKIIINTRESISTGKAWYKSLVDVVSNYQ